jgi:arylsulfatase A-like enzyme
MPKPLSRRRFLTTSASLAPALAIGTVAMAAPAKAPHIVFILADDMGFADLSCYGRRDYTTPVLDRLAEEGVLFRQAYASSAVCSATRTALVTGRYPQRFMVGLHEPLISDHGVGLPPGTPTIASRLKARGYRTVLVGKWHVGLLPGQNPTRFGYDSFFGISGGAADYFTHKQDTKGELPDDGLWQDTRRIDRPGYLTDVLGDEAIRQIEAPSDKPLFLSLHFTAPHWPWEGPEDAARSGQLRTLRDDDGGSLATYGKIVQSMDRTIGRVLDALAAKRMAENTIVVFTSDNGGERYSDTWPLSGQKGELLEGGIRVPLIVRWPGRVKADSVTEQVMVSMDFAPTLLAAAGGGEPAKDAFDGMNLLAQLSGKAPDVTRTVFWRFKTGTQAAVRDGNWKYLKLGNKEHLFDIARDPRERAELKAVHPEIFSRLKAAFAAWDADMLPYDDKTYSGDVKAYLPDRY